MFAIFVTGGKQYKVQEGDIVFVEKLNVNEGETITFDTVLAASTDDGFKTGAPYISGAKIEATVLKNAKSKKIHILRYKAKKNEKKKMGHRQPYSKIQINKVAL